MDLFQGSSREIRSCSSPRKMSGGPTASLALIQSLPLLQYSFKVWVLSTRDENQASSKCPGKHAVKLACDRQPVLHRGAHIQDPRCMRMCNQTPAPPWGQQAHWRRAWGGMLMLLPQETVGSFLSLLFPGGHTLSRPAGTKDKLSPGLHPLSPGSLPPSGSHSF